jgi:hypothetical protein
MIEPIRETTKSAGTPRLPVGVYRTDCGSDILVRHKAGFTLEYSAIAVQDCKCQPKQRGLLCLIAMAAAFIRKGKIQAAASVEVVVCRLVEYTYFGVYIVGVQESSILLR